MRWNHLLLVLSGPCLAGCGRPATEKDCEEIVERIVELELKSARIRDPGEVQSTMEETKQAFHERATEQCVGKRITDRALQCVRQATTAKQIVEECFD